LGTAELFILSSLRLWFLSHCDREHDYPDWRCGFENVGISTLGTWGFDRLCRVIGTTTVRSLDVHWLHCSRIGAYEACLLRAVGLLQSNREEAAEEALLEWCPPSAARLARDAAYALAESLRSHSLLIPVRDTYSDTTSTVVRLPEPVATARLH
jgi:hypothetical protein